MPAAQTESRFLTSTVAAYASQLGRMVVNFGMRVLLARLVLPEGHGLFELAFRIVLIASAVRDLGLPYQLVRDERRPYGTVLRSTLGLGVVVTLALLVGAPLTAHLDPTLPEVLRALAVWVVLDGLAVVPRAYFERELRIDRLVLPEILRAVAAAALALPFAWAGYGVWSLVAGELGAAAAFAALVWRAAWGRIDLRARLELLPDLLRRSYVLFLIWIVLILVNYVDVYLIGYFTNTSAVGYYARAYFIVFLVQTIMAPRALTAALVETAGDLDRFVGTFRVALNLLLTCQVLAGYFLFFNADRAVAILLGKNWAEAVPLVELLAFVPFLDPFTRLGGEMLKARHEDRLWLAAMVVNLVSLLAFGLLLTPRYGARGMAFANYLMVGSAILTWRVACICGRRFRGLLGDLVWIYLLPLPLYLIAARLAPEASWARFGASLVAAALGAGLLAFRFREPLRQFRAQRAQPASGLAGSGNQA